ncbi:protein turtle homolog A [Pundamilia nyererei]|uniref:Protein turtle homolog A n=1 Tax=Pundamilia nyererei TaxID=303518 RepID=A0A9Y3V833_9CICH|nr:PREDICTED: protein turtle homolog A-like [Pundamilia nyererei]
MGSARSYLQTFTVAVVICQFLTTEGLTSEVQAKAGSSVELECRLPSSDPAVVSSASQHVVEWIRQGFDIPVLIKFGSYAPRVHPQYEGRVSLVRITTLRLEGLLLADQGLYECRILSLDKPTDELQNGTWTVLSVTAPPAFTEPPPPVLEALVGSHISLSCMTNGNPTPAITWFKDGIAIQKNISEDGVLSLRAVSIHSAGQYTCHASNSEGNVTCVTKVKIKGPPVIVIPPKNTSLNMSQDAHLQCQAVADPPNMTYVWEKGGENVYHIESLKSRVKIMVDGTLLISRLIPEDSGNYTCVPTNGLLMPPTASALLTVMHPAQALKMPQETYLPTGMDGVVSCPMVAQPPLLRVDWMKDGEPVDLSLYPGWTLAPDGSLFMATVNDDAAGMYRCTPYNSYGTMGTSGPTSVILQDPPSFSITPEKQYKVEAGRTLLIPCQGNVDPTIKVTWSKVGLARSVSYSVEPDGSLLLQPLTKDHQGVWECSASNRVASVKTSTHVFVLGTSPHAATSLSVSPGVKQANISWEAGFDGGSAQTFSVWVKKISASDDDGKQDWFSVPVPPSSGTRLQVTGLSPSTDYQFSILSQNKMGTGPFSDIATTRTLDPPPRKNKLKPPTLLSANRSSAGVVLQWSLSEAQHPPVTGFVLQSRTEQGEWFNLDEDISANSSEIVVPGLHKDCVYELRLLSRRGDLLSEPSPSVNVSTAGMEIYPSTSRLLEFVPESLLAGVLGGVGFMLLALVLLLGSACIINRKRNQRRRKKSDEPPTAIYKCSPSIKTSGTSTPDSVLKKSLLPASSHYPTSSSTTTSSSLQTDCSSFSTENNNRRKHLMSKYSRDSLTKTTSLISPSIEMISRGPDGRFTLPPYDTETLSVHSKKSVRYDQHSKVRRSVSLHSEKEDRKERPFVLSVDLPPCKKSSYDGFPELSSLCSDSSLATIHHHDREMTPVFPVLPHIRAGLGQPSTTASALVLQMEHERERGNLHRCLKLAQEREELERELQWYTLERNSTKHEQSDLKRREDGGNELLWEYKSSTLPHRYSLASKENRCFSPSFLSSSSSYWETHPLVSPPTLIQSRTHLNASSAAAPSYLKSSNRHSSPFLPKQTSFQSAEAGSFSKARLTLPHLSLEHQRHERAGAAPESYNDSPQSTGLDMQTNDSCSEAQRQNNLSHGSLSTLSFYSNKYTERSNSALDALPGSSNVEVVLPKPTGEDLCVEMSVDEPHFEMCHVRPAKPMLHQRIASHVQGRTLTRRGRHHDMRRSTSLNCRGPVSVDDIFRVPDSSQPLEPHMWKAASQGSKISLSKQRSQSLDLRRRKESNFLTPDAWIDSLSQENCSAPSSCPPDSLFWKPQSAPPRKISSSPPNDHADTKYATYLTPAAADPLFSMSHPERPTINPNVPCHYEPRRETCLVPSAATMPGEYQEDMEQEGGYLEAVKGAAICLLPNTDAHEVLELEAGGYDGVPESGSSYSSYASSGLGSMEPSNGRLSMCNLSPTLISSPETIEDTQGNTQDIQNNKMESSQRY